MPLDKWQELEQIITALGEALADGNLNTAGVLFRSLCRWASLNAPGAS